MALTLFDYISHLQDNNRNMNFFIKYIILCDSYSPIPVDNNLPRAFTYIPNLIF